MRNLGESDDLRKMRNLCSESGKHGGWRGRAAGGRLKQDRGTSLCIFDGYAVLTVHLHHGLPERLELRISLPVSQNSQLPNTLGYFKADHL